MGFLFLPPEVRFSGGGIISIYLGKVVLLPILVNVEAVTGNGFKLTEVTRQQTMYKLFQNRAM